jgi:polyisoprenoid-binding protein YceI
MRKIMSVMALAVLPMTAIAADSYTIDPLHTFPNFTINHLGFSTMHGRFGKTSGKLMIDEAKHTGSVEVAIDAASVNTGFIKRDDHLRSPDFLNANEFPEITYKSTKVTITGDASKGDASAQVEGNLTISGVTKPVSLNVKRIHCGINPMDPKKEQYRCGFDAETSIKRSDFGVKFAVPAIGDDMNIDLEVEAIRD